MAVEITLLSGAQNENGEALAPQTYEFQAIDLATGETVASKNWFEKSKDKYHIVLGPNSANRKYIAHNEFFSKAIDGVYTVEDKTTGPRVLGSSKPDTKLVPFMSEEDKAKYDEIIARAEAAKNAPMTEAEKLEAEIARLTAKLEGKPVAKADYIQPKDQKAYSAIIERAAEAKANTPKAPRAPRRPLTPEQKIARDQKALAKLIAKLEALKAQG